MGRDCLLHKKTVPTRQRVHEHVAAVLQSLGIKFQTWTPETECSLNNIRYGSKHLGLSRAHGPEQVL